MTEHKETEELSFLIQRYQKEIWEWKQKESQWLSDKNLLAGSKKTIEEIANKLVEISKDNSALKKRAQEAEGELTIIKGIGNTSPEMKGLKSEVEALKQQLHVDSEKYKRENNDLYNRIAEALAVNESHQKLNGKLQERLTELEQENIKLHTDNKKMRNHLEERVDKARKSGM